MEQCDHTGTRLHADVTLDWRCFGRPLTRAARTIRPAIRFDSPSSCVGLRSIFRQWGSVDGVARRRWDPLSE